MLELCFGLSFGLELGFGLGLGLGSCPITGRTYIIFKVRTPKLVVTGAQLMCSTDVLN